MDWRDLSAVGSLVSLLVAVVYFIGQLKGRYVTKDELFEVERRRERERHESEIARSQLATKAELESKLDKILVEQSEVRGELDRVNKTLLRIIWKLWPSQAPTPPEGT